MFATAYLTKWHQNWIDREEEAREDQDYEEFQPDLSAAVAPPEEPREPSKRKRHDDGGARGNHRRQSLGGAPLNVEELVENDTLEGCLIMPKEQVLEPATTTKTCKGRHCIADPFECSAGQVDAKVILMKHMHY